MNNRILVVEQDITSGRKERVPKGVYILCSQYNSHTAICEHIGEEVKYNGMLKVDESVIIKYYFYALINGSSENGEGVDTFLPNIKFNILWNNIVYNEEFKYKIVNYILKIYFFQHIQGYLDLFSVNKCILIHGKPGMGKSTLCKAISQKVAIRSNKHLVLREVNCANIFNKYYGESMKILLSMLSSADENTIILIDEIDSLLSNRSMVFTKNEPNDTLRLVNIFLKILDNANSIYLFTSNFIDELDSAFIDRCDLILKIKDIEEREIYEIFIQTLKKAMSAQVIDYYEFISYSSVVEMGDLSDPTSFKLFNITNKLKGVSPRRIKKIIFESFNNFKESLLELLERIEKNIEIK